MLTLLKAVDNDGEEFAFRNISSWRLKSENVEGSGSGMAENGNKILDIRAKDMVTIDVTFDKLTIEQYTSIMSILKTDTIRLTFWRGYYDTADFAVGPTESELMKSNQRPNTVTSNRWQVSVTFTKIKMN